MRKPVEYSFGHIGRVILGSRFGLSLTLNIEQYEYMIGPQSDAGIKVSQLS